MFPHTCELDQRFKALYEHVAATVVTDAPKPNDGVFIKARLLFTQLFDFNGGGVRDFAVHVRSLADEGRNEALYQPKAKSPRWKYLKDFICCLNFPVSTDESFSREESLNALMDLSLKAYTERMQQFITKPKPFVPIDVLKQSSFRPSSINHSILATYMRHLHDLPSPWIHLLALNCTEWFVLRNWNKPNVEEIDHDACVQTAFAVDLIQLLTVPFYYFDIHETLLNVYCTLVHALVDRLFLMAAQPHHNALLSLISRYRLWPVLMQVLVPLWQRAELKFHAVLPSAVLKPSPSMVFDTTDASLLHMWKEQIECDAKQLSDPRQGCATFLHPQVMKTRDKTLRKSSRSVEDLHSTLERILFHAHLLDCVTQALESGDEEEEDEQKQQKEEGTVVSRFLSDAKVNELAERRILKHHFGRFCLRKPTK